mmetsp:Transcript_28855/g.92129  ORF Transcript_28855/g.92129 Transcript_28855/m.92129 type:complete len:209 (-) Transcript_28855:63-689(-)
MRYTIFRIFKCADFLGFSASSPFSPSSACSSITSRGTSQVVKYSIPSSLLKVSCCMLSCVMTSGKSGPRCTSESTLQLAGCTRSTSYGMGFFLPLHPLGKTTGARLRGGGGLGGALMLLRSSSPLSSVKWALLDSPPSKAGPSPCSPSMDPSASSRWIIRCPTYALSARAATPNMMMSLGAGGRWAGCLSRPGAPRQGTLRVLGSDHA